jgi:transcription elongation factor GreA
VTAKVGGETMRFLLGSREVAGDGIEVYSEKSPLGEAINGKHKGETASYDAPNGSTVPVEILDTEPFAG